MIKYFLVFIFATQLVSAKVFNMQEYKFGGYFSGNYGNSSEDKDYFKKESSATSYSKGFKTHTGGDFGFVYRAGTISWVFGMEFINPDKAKGTASSGGTTRYKYVASLSAVVPKIGMEIVFHETPTFRFL